MNMRVAYLVNPHIGGTYAIFLRLRRALGEFDVDFRCIAPEPEAAPSRFDDGIDRVPVPSALDEATSVLTDHLQRGGYEIVLATPGSGQLVSNLPPYLPPSIRCVARVCTMTHGAYRPMRAVAAHVDCIIAVSDRVRDDLVGQFRLPASLIHTIYNGVDLPPNVARTDRPPDSGLRMLYLGRLEDIDKGVFQLPSILKHVLRAMPHVRLDIAGTGPDETSLRSRLERAGLMPATRMVGAVAPGDVPACMAAHDCLLLPSRFEGCPSTLLEAMASGCVPIASRIRGSTVAIVEHGISGFLCSVGDIRAFARAAVRLARDRGLRARMARNAQQRIRTHFRADQMARRYAKLFNKVLASPSRRAAPLPIADYSVHTALEPTWRTRIPRPVKNYARKWAERLGVSL